MTIINALPFTLQNGTTADATQAMADFDEIVNDVNNNAAHNGVNTDITALTGLTTPITPAQGGTNVYLGGTSTGAANAQVVASPIPTGFTLTAGYRIAFIAGFTNTAATTFNINGTGVKNVFKPTPSGPVALVGGEIVAGNVVEAIYDGTQYQLVVNAQQTGGYGPLTTLASATTTDLGSVPSHNITISGAVTITGFGSSASTIYPFYHIQFQGALILTYNATSLILPGSANITTAAGDRALVEYLGSGNWRVAEYYRATGTAVVNPTPLAGAQGLSIANNAGTPNTNIDIAADQVVMINPTGNVPIYASAVSVTVNTTTTGANGLDTGARASSTWYNLFLISNGSTTAGLASLSATAPTLPSGYTYWVRVGAMRTDGSGNFFRTKQLGARAVYTPVTASNTTAPRQMASGSNTAWTAIAVGAFVPPTATQIKGVMASINPGNNTNMGVAPNNNYPTGTAGSALTTPWAFTNSTGTTFGSLVMTFELNLESTNIYYGSDQGSATTISCLGWTDKVNAN